MNASKVIEAMGGRAEVMRITRLSKGRLSQWTKENHIPRAWRLLFHQLNPAAIPNPDNDLGQAAGGLHAASRASRSRAKESSHA